MSVFKDQNGKEWTVAIDAPKIRAVRKECNGLDLGAVNGKPYELMCEDTVLLVDVLWVLCRDQARTAGLTDEQFGTALVGEAIERATAAMLDAILDFFPNSKKALLRTLATETQQVREEATRKAIDRVTNPELREKLLAAMDAQADREINSLLTRLAGVKSTPESAESTSPA